jgi:hypothetical protein
MQFIPSTWAKWARVAPDHPHDSQPSVDNAWDAIYTAAAYLCGGKGHLGDIDSALLSYNPSAEYVALVKQKAADYGWVNPELNVQAATSSTASAPPIIGSPAS